MFELDFQLELNRAWIYDDEDEEIVGEKNFVVPAVWLILNINEIVPGVDIGNEDDFDDFLGYYVPEEDGEAIYEAAKRMGKIIEEFDTYYEDEEDEDE